MGELIDGWLAKRSGPQRAHRRSVFCCDTTLRLVHQWVAWFGSLVVLLDAARLDAWQSSVCLVFLVILTGVRTPLMRFCFPELGVPASLMDWTRSVQNGLNPV